MYKGISVLIIAGFHLVLAVSLRLSVRVFGYHVVHVVLPIPGCSSIYSLLCLLDALLLHPSFISRRFDVCI